MMAMTPAATVIVRIRRQSGLGGKFINDQNGLANIATAANKTAPQSRYPLKMIPISLASCPPVSVLAAIRRMISDGKPNAHKPL